MTIEDDEPKIREIWSGVVRFVLRSMEKMYHSSDGLYDLGRKKYDLF